MNSDALKQAITAIKSGDKLVGRKILADEINRDPKNESAWMWLAVCVEQIEQKRFCLNRVLAINPNNQPVRQALAELENSVDLPTPNAIAAARTENSSKPDNPRLNRFDKDIQIRLGRGEGCAETLANVLKDELSRSSDEVNAELERMIVEQIRKICVEILEGDWDALTSIYWRIRIFFKHVMSLCKPSLAAIGFRPMDFRCESFDKDSGAGPYSIERGLIIFARRSVTGRVLYIGIEGEAVSFVRRDIDSIGVWARETDGAEQFSHLGPRYDLMFLMTSKRKASDAKPFFDPSEGLPPDLHKWSSQDSAERDSFPQVMRKLSITITRWDRESLSMDADVAALYLAHHALPQLFESLGSNGHLNVTYEAPRIIPASKPVHPSSIGVWTMKVVGVTYGNRQLVISRLQTGEEIRFRWDPLNDYNHNAVIVETMYGEQIGFVPKEYSAQLRSIIEPLGGSEAGWVKELTGGVPAYPNRGVVVCIGTPGRKNNQDLDEDEYLVKKSSSYKDNASEDDLDQMAQDWGYMDWSAYQDTLPD